MPNHKPKIDNSVLGIVSILAIVLIVFMALNFKPTSSTAYDVGENSDLSGYASQVLTKENLDVPLCKMVIGLSTLYDGTVLGVTLEEGASATYFGQEVKVTSINADGCVVEIGSDSDYLAIGQIQRVGYLYVTVKDVVN